MLAHLSVLALIWAFFGFAAAARAYLIPVFFIFPIAFTLNRLGQHYDIDPADPAKWGTLMRGSKEDVQSGRYPYDRFVYVYVRRLPGQPVDPFVKEYLRMALSKEGQEAMAADAKGYLPLNPVEISAELAKLD